MDSQFKKLDKAKKRYVSLVIKDEKLEDDTKYRLNLCADYEGGSSCAEIDVQTRGTPYPGIRMLHEKGCYYRHHVYDE